MHSSHPGSGPRSHPGRFHHAHAPVLAALMALMLAACSDQPPTGPPGAPHPKLNVVVLGYTDLGTLGGDPSQAIGVNALGQVVGSSIVTGTDAHAFLWTSAGGMRDLGTLGGDRSFAAGVNALGHVVGSSDVTPNLAAQHAFLWQNGAMLDLGTLGGTSSEAAGVNAFGQVVGRSFMTTGAAHAFLWRDGAMHDLGTLGGPFSDAAGVNDLGQVVGSSYVNFNDQHAFLWQNGAMRDLGTLGGNNSSAAGINALGQVVGGSTTDGILATHAFLWQNDGHGMQDLGSLGSNRAVATGINDLGQVVGASGFAGTNAVNRAFLWQDGTMEDLGTLGGETSVAFAISNDGQVVGEAALADGSHHAVLWTVALRAQIDVAPGDPTNTIKLSRATVDVAVLGTPYFDASRVSPATVTLGNEDGNDASVQRNRRGVPQAVFKDVDRDGDTDVLLTFDRSALVARGDLTLATTKLVLSGKLTTNKAIRGVNRVAVVR